MGPAAAPMLSAAVLPHSFYFGLNVSSQLHEVETRSLCVDGVQRISYDPARFPRYLPEAYCLCRGCLTGLFGEEDFRFRSTPVYSPAVVLRRTAACAGGRSVYAEQYVTIPVGCTCVPEPDKASDSANSSMDKPGAKLLLGPNDKPAGR
ncbi:hypothetical protein STEG23_009250 [Scotinomys teguina]